MSLITAPARLTSRLLTDAAERLDPEPEAQAPAATPQREWFSGKAQQLWCGPGDHAWARVAVRGRKPPACPEHAGGVIGGA